MLLNTLAVSLLLPLSQALRSSGNGVLAEPEMAPKRVAIIGAGAAGSSAAYHLSQSAQDAGIPTQIHVFERSSHIGGRCTTVHAWSDPKQPVELGASIFVEVNHILVSASKTFNLTTAAHELEKPREGTPELGVWNGKEFVFISSGDNGWWDLAKLLWRYGYSPIKTNGLMKSTVARFLKMYEKPLFPWSSLSEAVQEAGLLEVTGVTGEQFLKEKGVSDKFATEIVQASTRVNYAQNLGLIHGLETMVCMAANGAMSITGGNWQIFSRMLHSSSAISTHLNTTIAQISKQPDNTYNLTTSSGEVSTFDDIVLAAPLQSSSLVIEPQPKHTPDQIPYVKLHVTLFASPFKLDPAAFGMKDGSEVPQYVLTTLPPSESHGSDPNGCGSPGFFSVSIVGNGVNPLLPEPRPEIVYKIFSPHRINSTFLSNILGRKVTDDEAEDGDPNGAVSWIYHKVWHSYPYEFPRVTFDEIKLDEGLWYTSGIESFISTMETSALMGKNVAQLIVDEWTSAGEPEPKQDGETLKVQGDDAAWQFKPLDNAQGQQKPLKAKL